MRTSVFGIALVLSACGPSASPSPSPSPPEPTAQVVAAPVATSAAPEGSAAPSISVTTPPVAARVSSEASRAVAAAVREGRREAHAGHLPEALAAFDRALALVPGQPRVLCEAGFVAHRAGDEAGAARRIDSALHVFGPAEHARTELRQPLAMCLYNRGLVAEAQHQGEEAARAYRASLALRPNETVSAALARAQASVTGADVADEAMHVGGALVEDDLVRVTSIDALADVLRHGMRGWGDDGALPVAPSAVEVYVRATLARPGSGAEVVLLVVDNGDTSYREQRLVVAERTGEGYRVGALQVGAQDLMVSESEGDSRLLDLRSRWDGDVLVLDVTTSTNEGSFDTVEDDHGGYCNVQIHHVLSATAVVICPADAACVAAPIAHGDTGADVYRECDDDEGEGAHEAPVETLVAVRARVEGDVVIVEGSGDDSLLAPGRYALDDLAAEPLEIPSWRVDAA